MGKSETRIDTGEGGRATQSYGTRDTAFQCDKRGAKRAPPKKETQSHAAAAAGHSYRPR